MLKKYSIITLLIFSYTLVLGHSIIPHYHHDDHEMGQSSHQHDHHDSDHRDQESDHHDEDDSSLSHNFENYFHSGETGDFHQQSKIQISRSTIGTVYLIALFDFKIKAYESPLPIVRHSNDHISFLQCCLSSKGLRAPPCALV